MNAAEASILRGLACFALFAAGAVLLCTSATMLHAAAAAVLMGVGFGCMAVRRWA